MAEINGNGNGWRTWLMGAMMTIIMALSGLTYQQSAQASADLQATVAEQARQIQESREEIRDLKAWREYQQRQLDRIEQGVEDLKRRR